MAPKKIRLDQLLVEKKLAATKESAQRYIMAGEVRVNGEVVLMPSSMVKPLATILLSQKPKFVSRGGEKLEPALIAFGLDDLKGVTAVDVGSSTGGFTDCILQHGAEKVFAIDVGYGILHWKLRKDDRVVVMERTNARYVKTLPEPIDLVTIDASFISLKVLLPVIQEWFTSEGGQIIALIKPQFEASRKDAAKEVGVIRDKEVHRKILLDILDFVVESGFAIEGLIQSPIKGPKGNVEFLGYFVYPGKPDLNGTSEVVDRLLSQPDDEL